MVLSVNSRFAKRFVVGSSYSYAKATDNSLGIKSRFHPTVLSGSCRLSPKVLIRMPTVHLQLLKEGLSPRRDNFTTVLIWIKDLRHLALDHVFQVNGLVDLPWQFQISAFSGLKAVSTLQGQMRLDQLLSKLTLMVIQQSMDLT